MSPAPNYQQYCRAFHEIIYLEGETAVYAQEQVDWGIACRGAFVCISNDVMATIAKPTWAASLASNETNDDLSIEVHRPKNPRFRCRSTRNPKRLNRQIAGPCVTLSAVLDGGPLQYTVRSECQ